MVWSFMFSILLIRKDSYKVIQEIGKFKSADFALSESVSILMRLGGETMTMKNVVFDDIDSVIVYSEQPVALLCKNMKMKQKTAGPYRIGFKRTKPKSYFKQ